MKKGMTGRLCIAALLALVTVLRADAAEVVLNVKDSNASVQINGDKDREWWLESSSDLSSWSRVENFAPLLSSGTNPPARSITLPPGGLTFFRARETDGLYDTTVFRTISLTFTQANWATLLANARTTEGNVPCVVTLDNGATNSNVGARYKGNTSYTMGGTKKSINLDFHYADTNANLMDYTTINLNNAAADETIMREPVYFTVMNRYTVSPKAAMCKLYINGEYWGVYSLVQQENNQLIKEWFPSTDGDRWKAPNAGGGTGGGPGGPGGGGGFTSAASALSYLGATASSYTANYELKSTTNSTVAWNRLVNAINVLNNTPAVEFQDKVQDVLDVDRWLWFLGIEIIFADDDSYFNKGADYGFYYEPESGRIAPVQHDGNEAFTAGDVSLSPVVGETGTNRPVLYKLLPVPEFRQRYLAHMRTVLEESFSPAALYPLVTQFHSLSVTSIVADTKKSFTMAAYTNDLTALKSFIATRYAFLTNHAELKPIQPNIVAVNGPAPLPGPSETPHITAEVLEVEGNGVDSVWLYYRTHGYGRFTVAQMFDDGAHGDGAANDNVYGAATAAFPAGTKVRYYVEARSANTAKAARFAPARAEEVTFNYRVGLASAPNTPVVINEFMASNSTTLADPQGEFDDWIELHNVTDSEVDLTGRYLSDEPTNPRKWQFPAGTKIPADGYLVVWADEDGSAPSGLHASFKLSASGEQIYLTDTDTNLNAVLDSVTFDEQQTDKSYGRRQADPDVWSVLVPTPGKANE